MLKFVSHIKAIIYTEDFGERGAEEDIWTYRYRRKARESCRMGRFVTSTHRQILLGDQSKKVPMDGHVSYVEQIDSLEDRGVDEE